MTIILLKETFKRPIIFIVFFLSFIAVRAVESTKVNAVEALSTPPPSITYLNLTPKTAIYYVGIEYCWEALVTDENSDPVFGIRVDFMRKGASGSYSTFTYTDTNGIAKFCFEGDTLGIDSVFASTGLVNDTAVIEWECPTSEEFIPEFYSRIGNVGDTVIYADNPLAVNYTTYSGSAPSFVDISYKFTGATIDSGSGTGSGKVFNLGTTHITLGYRYACGVVFHDFDLTVDPSNVCQYNIPNGPHVYHGDAIFNTQTQLNQFVGNNNDTNQGKVYTKIVGNLTLKGNHPNDPITSLCNLFRIREITGNFMVDSFNMNGNPEGLAEMWHLGTVGGGFRIANCPKFIDLEMGIVSVGQEISIQSNENLIVFNMDSLKSVGTTISVRNNDRLEDLKLSREINTFAFTGTKHYLNIYNNGRFSINPLNIYLEKIVTINGNLQFSNNDNPGVNNLDDILPNLSSVSGSMSVNNNDYLAQCCIAVDVTVGNKRNVRNNTGNCADLGTAQNYCSNLLKRGERTILLNSDLYTELSINPSPNNGTFEMHVVTSQEGSLNVSITDLMGREIWKSSHKVQDGIYIPFNLENAAEGQYILKAELNGNVEYRRIQVIK